MRKERCLSRARLLSWLRPHEGDVVFNGTGRLVVPKLKFRTIRWSVADDAPTRRSLIALISDR